MDNLITSAIAVAIFLAFIIGLAVSIKSIPFAVIIFMVTVMILIEFYEAAIDGLKSENKDQY